MTHPNPSRRAALVGLVALAIAVPVAVVTGVYVDSTHPNPTTARAVTDALPPVTVPAPRTSPAVTLVDRTWHCRTPQNGATVTVTIRSVNIDAVHLDAGCTGKVTLHVTTSQRDGVKLHAGAHDLLVLGDITCAGKAGDVHQDGIQAMGGLRVTFTMKIRCPSSNNGAIFINSGVGKRGIPTEVVCDHCDLYGFNAAVHVGPGSRRSGARDSTLWQGGSTSAPRACVRIDPKATLPLNLANTCNAGSPTR